MVYRTDFINTEFFIRKSGNKKTRKSYYNKISGLFIMAGATRIELATSGLTARRSNQSELRPRKKGLFIAKKHYLFGGRYRA
jgi:hypothetical protein